MWYIYVTALIISIGNSVQTYPMMELVAIMKSLSCTFITLALKNFDFVWILRNLSGLTRSRYTSLVLSPSWNVSFKCFVSVLRSWGWHKSLIVVPIRSYNRTCLWICISQTILRYKRNKEIENNLKFPKSIFGRKTIILFLLRI